jgi:RimJ/RimL family protein N-acetyltransferase
VRASLDAHCDGERFSLSRGRGSGVRASQISNSFNMRIILETLRLQLRELTLDDLDFVAAMLAHPEVMHFWPKTYNRAEAEAWIRRQQERYTQDGYGYWLAVNKANVQPIGQAGLLRQEATAQRKPASATSFTGHSGGRVMRRRRRWVVGITRSRNWARNGS